MPEQVTSLTERVVALATNKRPLWVRSYLSKSRLPMNALSHLPQTNGLDSLWVRSSARKPLPALSALSHSEHYKWLRSAVQ
jgi:hypothetical protein